MAADRIISKGDTDVFLTVPMRSATTGLLLGSIAYSAVTVKYQRDGIATATTVTITDGTLGTHNDSTWKETQIAGVYQLCLADAAFATGANGVVVTVTASGAIDKTVSCALVAVNPQSATAFITGINGQAHPSAVPGASGGLLIAGSNAATTFAGIATGSWNNTGATTYTGNIVKGGTETGVIAYQGTLADEINNNGSTFQYPTDTFAADSDFTGMTMVFTSSTIPAARKIIAYSRNSSIESAFTLDEQPAHDYQQGDTFLILYDRGHAVTTPVYSPVLQGASNLATTFAGFAAGGLTMTSIRNSGATTYVGAISAPSTSNSWAGTLARVTLVDTTTDLTNQSAGGDIEITEQDVTIT